ncbi:MAG TPA: ATP-binding protein [Candidatus Dormibacteraeota bacterium]|nr:ATP-binding protein [Candidatus Dormibacteraeota bacterium]
MASSEPRIRAQLTELIVARIRLLTGIVAGGAAVMAVANQLLMPAVSPYLFPLQAGGATVAVFAVWLLHAPSVRARPVPIGLLLFAVVCAVRVAVGWLTHDLAATTILAVGLILTLAATVPWGLWPQLATAALGAMAIAGNGALIGVNVIGALGPSAAAVALALGLSVLLAYELEAYEIELMTEIGHRRRSEAELARLNAELEHRVRARTAELEAVIENSGDAIWSVDRTGALRVINGAAHRRLAKRYGAAYDPRDPVRPVSPAVRAQYHALYERAFAGEHVQIERSIEAPGGVGHFAISVHPIVEDGAVVGATIFSSDITAPKRAEEQARQHQADLAHVLRIGTMGEMAAGLAHEINQPLGAIANYALGAVRRLRAGDAVDHAALLEVAEHIGAEALRAGEIIRRLRGLLRKEEPQPQPVDLNEVARASARVVEGEALRQGVDLDLELAATLPPVLGDPIQLEQVLLNLLLNGIEASAATANESRRVVVRTGAGAGDVEVAVSDHGVGLPPPPADVFAPFFTTKPRGLGMGLSISRSIVELHGGHLAATRNPDRGSTFRLTLPSEPAAVWRRA